MLFDKDAAYEHETFKGLKQEGLEMTAVDFYDVLFDGCNFQKAAFLECKFEKCRFVNCDLSLAKFQDASFPDTEFDGCKMLGIDWTQTAKSFFTVGFARCILNDSRFVGANLRRVKMVDCLAKRADFEAADLSDADCEMTDFEGANFLKTELTRADFRQAKNYSIDPSVNKLKKAKFTLPEALSLLAYLDITVD